VQIGFWWGNLQERGHLENPGTDGMSILRWIFCKWDGGMNWIDLAQDRGRWQALVNTIMILQVPQNGGNFLTSSEPVSFSRRTLLDEVHNGQRDSKLMGWCCWVMGRDVKQEANRK